MQKSQFQRIRDAFPNAEIEKLKEGTWIIKEGDDLYLSVTELQLGLIVKHTGPSEWDGMTRRFFD